MVLEVVVEVVFPQVSVLLKEWMENREVSRDLEIGLDISLAAFVQLHSGVVFPVGRSAPWEGEEPSGCERPAPW